MFSALKHEGRALYDYARAGNRGRARSAPRVHSQHRHRRLARSCAGARRALQQGHLHPHAGRRHRRTARLRCAPERAAPHCKRRTRIERCGDAGAPVRHERSRARCAAAPGRRAARRLAAGAPARRRSRAFSHRSAPSCQPGRCAFRACLRTGAAAAVRTARTPTSSWAAPTSCAANSSPTACSRPSRWQASKVSKKADHDPTDPQHRHHRPRRPWQDHAGRPAAAPERHLPREREGGRACDGQQRPGKGTRHHHPGEELRGGVEGHAHQHRRHARPRRLRRRGRARAVDGRQRAAAGRCRRRPDAADALRHQEGAGAGPQAHRRGEQGRPPRRAARLRHQRDLRSVRQAARHRGPARLSGDLRLGPERLGHADAGRGRHRPDAAVRRDAAACAGARRQPRRPAATADLLARLFHLRRAHRHRSRQPGHAQADAGRGGVQRPRQHTLQGACQPGAQVRRPGAQAGHRSRPRRHRAHQRHRRHRHRRDTDRLRQPAAAADVAGRRAHLDDELLRQQLAAGRARRQVRHQPPDPRPAGPRVAEQRGAEGQGDRRGRHLRSLRTRRTAPDDPAGNHAPRGLRAGGEQAARRVP